MLSENIPTEVLCYTTCLPEGTSQHIPFMELLLNENWANGQIVCSEEVYPRVGYINHQLTAKQNYEFLLRAALKYPIKLIGIPSPPLILLPSSLPLIIHGTDTSPTVTSQANINKSFFPPDIFIRW